MANAPRNQALHADCLSQCLDDLVSLQRSDREKARRRLCELSRQDQGERLRLLLRHDDFRVRAQVAEVLGDSGERDLAQDLLPLITDPQWPVRAQALAALAKLNPSGTAQQITFALADEEELVQLAALDCLRLTDCAPPGGAVKQLRRLAQSTNRALRETARALLAKLPERV